MYKRWLGIGIIVILVGIMIFNFIDEKNDGSSSMLNTVENAENDDLLPLEMSGIKEGEFAPDFKLETLDGDNVQLSDYRGKKVLLNFWATWCGPCRKEMPAMQEFYDEFGDDIEILAVNLNGTNAEKTVNDVQDFMDEFDFTYPILLDIDTSVGNEYMVMGLPSTYFIGTDGKIKAPIKMGEMTYEYMVEMMETLE
ncbi:MAG TPA: redoxin domain-containing protein [Candidatus Dormibacteraeota bacterium]|nr:redoxin domain-containing protein [Candidatus Dormibacteraeota bacterium]